DYEIVRRQAEQTFERLITDSARRLEATGQSVPSALTDALLHDILAALPAPDQLRERLVLRYRVGVFHLGSEFLGEQRHAGEERRRLDVAESDLRFERQLIQERLWAERERLSAQARAEEQERQREAAIKERLRQLRLDAARERLQDTLSPLEDGARQLHSTVFEAAIALRESLRKNRALHGSSARKVRDLARWFSSMNWTDDQKLEALIGELEALA